MYDSCGTKTAVASQRFSATRFTITIRPDGRQSTAERLVDKVFPPGQKHFLAFDSRQSFFSKPVRFERLRKSFVHNTLDSFQRLRPATGTRIANKTIVRSLQREQRLPPHAGEEGVCTLVQRRIDCHT
jgi:hypothetical protein